MNRQEFIQLLDKYLEGTASEEEQALLFDYYQKRQTTNEWDEEKLGSSMQTSQHIWDKLEADINKKVPQASAIPLYRRGWLQAAAVLAIVFTGAALWYNPKVQTGQAQLPKNTKPAPVPLAIHQAVLTLNDGTNILLDNAADGVLAMQGNTVVKKWGRKLIYEPALQATSKKNLTPMYNRIATAKGTQYQVVMPDGSNAWLNAASAMRFLAGGTQAVRRVEVEGEVYFEVAKHKAQTFEVTVKAFATNGNAAIMEALGTSFNINAYSDEPAMRTTLLKGSLRIHTTGADSGSRTLAPGQQALLKPSNSIEVKKADMARVIAWQEGLFDFEGANTREVMRQLSRWYDVEVAYASNSNGKRFSGRLSRAMALGDVLKVLEQSGVRFEIAGKKITVLS